MQCIDLAMHHVSAPETARMPRDRYMTYYRDLAKHYGVELVESSVYQGGQYSSVDLIQPVMVQLALRHNLQHIGYCMIAEWATDFDPDHSSFGPYVMDRWQLKARLYSVLDQGTLSPITCLKMAFYLSKIQPVLLLSTEQTTVPEFTGIRHFKPLLNGAAAMLLHCPTSIHDPACFHILACDIIEECLLIQQLTALRNDTNSEVNPIYVSSHGLMSVYQALVDIQCQHAPGYYALFIHDVETKHWGYIFLYKPYTEKEES